MKECRKNAAACTMTSDTIYVFGGTSNTQTMNSIEQFSITTSKWTQLKVRLPFPLSFMSVMKMNETKIIVLGGSRKAAAVPKAEDTNSSLNSGKTSSVYLFDLIDPNFTRLNDLSEPFISMYPPFYDQRRGTVTLVNEDCNSQKPTVLTYSILDQL